MIARASSQRTSPAPSPTVVADDGKAVEPQPGGGCLSTLSPDGTLQALGVIDGRLHVLVFTPRAGKTHVISLRKANRREVNRYEAQA